MVSTRLVGAKLLDGDLLGLIDGIALSLGTEVTSMDGATDGVALCILVFEGARLPAVGSHDADGAAVGRKDMTGETSGNGFM